mgnify:CR=1 FL=1
MTTGAPRPVALGYQRSAELRRARTARDNRPYYPRATATMPIFGIVIGSAVRELVSCQPESDSCGSRQAEEDQRQRI